MRLCKTYFIKRYKFFMNFLYESIFSFYEMGFIFLTKYRKVRIIERIIYKITDVFIVVIRLMRFNVMSSMYVFTFYHANKTRRIVIYWPVEFSDRIVNAFYLTSCIFDAGIKRAGHARKCAGWSREIFNYRHPHVIIIEAFTRNM